MNAYLLKEENYFLVSMGEPEDEFAPPVVSRAKPWSRKIFYYPQLDWYKYIDLELGGDDDSPPFFQQDLTTLVIRITIKMTSMVIMLEKRGDLGEFSIW